jgi:predicted AlkP superfamily phosphohydrolase/phosphomutase
VNPGKHGIFDFQKEDAKGGPPIMEQATNRRALPVWMLLSDAGYRVGILNVPMTFPPDPVRGKMISGFPFPSGDVVVTYPPELSEELPDYPLDVLGLSLFEHTQDEMLREFHTGLQARADVAESWLVSGDFDFLWFVFTAPDKVQHFFWKDMDPNHPRHDPAAPAGYGDAILDVWKAQDAILGRLFAAMPENTRVIMMSDHGFEAVYWQINLQNWLVETELVDWLADHATPPMMVTNGVLHYSVEGQLTGGSDRAGFLDVFSRLCRDFRDPTSGAPAFESVFTREDLYEGRMLSKAPDIVFHEAPFYYSVTGFPDSTGVPFVQAIYSTSFSAYHRPEGIVAMAGPGLRPASSGDLRSRLEGGGDLDAHIMDIAPTVLALFGETVPDLMDGKPIETAFSDSLLGAQPIVRGDVPGFLFDRAEPVLSEEEKEQLEAVPYLQ